jgi:probable F420-dependent oxidoreductase
MSSGELRFGAVHFGTDREDLAATVRLAESLGYDTFLLPDHLYTQQLSPIPALATIAEMTDTMRIGTWVMCNDFHHPVILARELATLEALSGGRLDIGLGAGYVRDEYENAGIKFDPGGERVRRLQDSVVVIKAMFGADRVTVDTDHYQVRDSRVPAPGPTAPSAVHVGRWRTQVADLGSGRGRHRQHHSRPHARRWSADVRSQS